MPTVQFEKFVNLSNFFFKTLGIQPYEVYGDKKNSWQSYVLFSVILLNTGLTVFCEIVYVMISIYTRTNFLEAIMTCAYIGFVFVGLSKMLYIWSKRQELSLFMQQLMELFPKTYLEQQKYDLSRYLRLNRKITVNYSIFNMILIWIYNMFAAGQYLIADLWLGLREVGKQLPYLLWIPWNYEGHWSYYVLYTALSFAGYSCSAGLLANDLLLFSIAMQVIMHYDYLAKAIEEYEAKGMGDGADAVDGRKEDLEFLRSIVVYHGKVLNLSERMNDVFGVPLLLNFMTSSFVICFVGFHMTIDVPREIQIKLLFYLVLLMAQVYLICYFGQKLCDVSQNVAKAVYHQNWLNADLRYKKMLVIIAMRAQKPAWLKASRFICISLNTMTEIMQVSYKFFALLRTMYSE